MEDASGGEAEGLLYVGDFSIWLLLLFTVLIILALFGNLLVVASIFWDRALRRQPENLFLVSLAVSDLLVSILVMVFAASNDLLGYWPFGNVYCQFWICFDITCCTASILNLCAISLDRYWHISRPMVYVRYCNRRRIYYAIVVVWLISGFIGAAPLGFGIGSNFTSYSNESEPVCEMKLPLPYAIASSLLSFFLPAAVMVLLYTKLYLYARRHVRSIRTQLKQATSFLIMQLASEKIREVTAATLNGERLSAGASSTAFEGPRASLVSCRSPSLLHSPYPSSARLHCTYGTAVSSSHPNSSPSKFMNLSTWDKLVRLLPKSKREKTTNEHNTPSNQTKNISDQKARLTLGVIMGTFLLCWLPFFLVNIWRSWMPEKVHHQLILAVTWLGYANSAANPLIYSIFNRDFRRAFKKIIIEIFRCCEDRNLSKSQYICSSRQMVAADVERRKASCTRSSESHAENNNNAVFAAIASSSSAGNLER